ncbi:MAG: diguanylate cyclase [Deltaproteobacteria bacterium]
METHKTSQPSSNPNGKVRASDLLRPPAIQRQESPLRMVIIVAFAIFIAEVLSMLTILILPPFPDKWMEIVFDALFLVTLISPVLYYLVLQPLLLHLSERKRFEAFLVKSADDLERIIAERTTELKDANSQLLSEAPQQKALQEEYKTILRTAMDGFIIVDRDGRFTDMNDAYCRIIGYAREELLRMGVWNVEAVEDRSGVQARMKKIAETGSDRFETKHKRKDGVEIDVEVSVNYMNVDNGCFFSFIRDITGRKRMDAELIAAKAELEGKVAERKLELSDANTELIYRATKLECLNYEITMIREAGDALSTCISAEEAYTVIAQHGGKCFPDDSGALFIMNPSKNILDAVSVWGPNPPEESVFVPEDCWAIRRGKRYSVNGPGAGVRCAHVKEAGSYLCVPMIAQGDMIGVLHLSLADSDGACVPDERMQDRERLLTGLSEHAELELANIRLRQTLRNLSIRDPLTSLFNRRYMEESFEKEIHRAKRKNVPVGVLMLDLDHFKDYNDTFGHEAGDMLLRELGVILQGNIRASDIACRYGGEEFTVILPEAAIDVTCGRGEQIRQAVRRLQLLYGGRPLGAVTVSVGAAVYPEHGLNARDVINAADEALYKAKAEGRDRLVVAENALAKASKESSD